MGERRYDLNPTFSNRTRNCTCCDQQKVREHVRVGTPDRDEVDRLVEELNRHDWDDIDDMGVPWGCSCGARIPNDDVGHEWMQEHRARALLAAGVVTGGEVDNADLARQLAEASSRRADAYDEGFDEAMRRAHAALNQRGYIERLSDDNGNPYRTDASASGTDPWLPVADGGDSDA